MPWEHCGESIPDDETCPVCDTSKTAWTLEVEVTRNFQLARRPTLRLALITGEADPVAHERYVVERPDGEQVEGELDDEGRAKINCPEAGPCVVTFPDFREGMITLEPDEDEEEEGEGEEEGATAEADEDAAVEPEAGDGDDAGEDAPARFELETRHRRYVLRVAQEGRFSALFHYEGDDDFLLDDTLTLYSDGDGGEAYSRTFALTDTEHVEDLGNGWRRATFTGLVGHRAYSLKVDPGMEAEGEAKPYHLFTGVSLPRTEAGFDQGPDRGIQVLSAQGDDGAEEDESEEEGPEEGAEPEGEGDFACLLSVIPGQDEDDGADEPAGGA